MRINIHRGQNQIGGSIIEISSETTRIIFDAGLELDDDEQIVPQIDGLFQGIPKYNAVFISHYHGDHIGLCENILPEIPIYIGKNAGELTNAARRYLRKDEYSFENYYESDKSITIGDITITPFLCDHSAFDSYMFHIVCDGKSILYTGDFRSNGRKNFTYLLNKLPKVDSLIVEGTTLSRTDKKQLTEKELEKIAIAEILKVDDKPVFILMAATNIDRLVTIFKAARRNNRILLQDLYLAEVSSAIGGTIPNPESFSGIKVFNTNPYNGRYNILNTKYKKNKIGVKGIAKEKFVMCARPSMKSYIDKIEKYLSFQGGILFYSMWEGYKEKDDIKDFLQYMESKGVTVINLHTSGHADNSAIENLIERVKPSVIVPVHTENAIWFDKYKNIKISHKQETLLD